MYTDDDVRCFARAAVRLMVQSSNEMSKDEEYNIPTGDITETIRDQALDYAADMLRDFEHEVLQAIRELKFSSVRTCTLKFEE
jgi:hypothetical protein